MKVLHICHTDIKGGAAKAAYRLHRSLLSAGIDSKMLVADKSSDDFTVKRIQASLFKKLISKVIGKYNNFRIKSRYYFSTGYCSSNILKQIELLDPDIVNSHWISRDILNINLLSKIKKPIVYTLHDMWPMTGGCHHSFECIKYKTHCGSCPDIGSKVYKDLSYKIFENKKKALKNVDSLTVVGPSSWIADCAKKSALLSSFEIKTIGNALDTIVFRPIDKKVARDTLNLDQNKKIILSGACGGLRNTIKGFDLLLKSIKKLTDHKKSNKLNYQLVFFGSGEPESPLNLGMDVKFLGKINDEATMALLYSAADLVVTPSLRDNLPQVAVESLACGTPVVAFNVGGLPDIVDHKVNGYLVKPYDISDLANGINWVLHESDYSKLSKNAVSKVKNNFSRDAVVPKYIELYKNILNLKSSK